MHGLRLVGVQAPDAHLREPGEHLWMQACRGVCERGGQGFIDEHGLMRRDYRLHLLEMHAAIHAFEHDGIHVPAQFFDAVVDSHAIFFAKLLRVSFDARRSRPGFLQRLNYLVGNCLHLSLVGAAGDQEVVSETGDLAQIQHHAIDRFLFARGAKCKPNPLVKLGLCGLRCGLELKIPACCWM